MATATWSSYGGDGVQHDGNEANITTEGSIPSPGTTGYTIVPLAISSIHAWATGYPPNGWVLTSDGPSAGWSFSSADAVDPSRRPLLTVEYTPPPAVQPPAPTYAVVAGQPPSPREIAWFDWEQNLVATRVSRVPAARPATFYFSQAGDDLTGQGSIEHPWKSLAKAQEIIDASNGNIRIRFRGGDVWREDIGLNVNRSNVTVDSYGTGTAYINEFTRQYASGWTLVSGNLWKRSEPNDIGWLREASSPLGHIYKREDSSAHVGSYAYSFWRDPTGTDPNSNGVPTLFLNAGPGVNPNTLAGGFEATGWTGGWSVSGDNVRLQNLRVHGAGILSDGTGYGLILNQSNGGLDEFVGIGLEFYYTGYHSFGQIATTGSAVFLDCKGGLCTNRPVPDNPLLGGTTTFVSYSRTGGHEFIMSDCEVSYGTLPSADWEATPGARHPASEGVLQHGTTTSGPPALSLSVRTRYPNNPWQNATGTALLGPYAASLENVRAYIVGESYDAVYSPIGRGTSDVAWINCSLSVRPQPSPYPFVIYGYLDSWVINGTFHADLQDWPGWGGGGFSWFDSLYPMNVRLENCQFEAVNLNAEYMNVFYPGRSLGPDALIRNSTITFEGTRPAGLGMPADSHWRNNAYRLNQPVPPNYLSGDPGAVVLGATPPDIAPSQRSPLYGKGAPNGIGYDRTGLPRPFRRFDIGPLTGVALPAPASAALTWGTRTASIANGASVGWAGIRELRFTFAAPVDVYRTSLTLVGSRAGYYAFRDFSYDPATRTAVWRLASPIYADQLTAILDGQVAYRFNVLAGDVDMSGTVDKADLRRIADARGTASAAEDIDGSGLVTEDDYQLATKYLSRKG